MPRRVLIYTATGAAGTALAEHFAQRKGIQLLILAGRDPKRLEELAQRLHPAPVGLLPIAEDGGVTALLALHHRTPLDTLLFPIGDHRPTPSGSSLKLLTALLHGNLTLPLHVALTLGPKIEEGNLLFFSDAALRTPRGEYHAYYAAKAGVDSLVRTLALALAPTVRVNGIAPGILNLKPWARSDAETRLSSEIPLKRLGGFAPLIQAVEFFLTNPYTTGVTLPLDGGARLYPCKNT